MIVPRAVCAAILLSQACYGQDFLEARKERQLVSWNTWAWTAWSSEEHGGYSADWHFPIRAAECSGNHCDNLRLLALTQGVNGKMQVAAGKGYWTAEFSEDKNGQLQVCGDGYVVTQIQCLHSHCDNKRLRCEPVSADWSLGESSWVTDTFGSGMMKTCSGSNGVVTGWACHGHLCETQQFRCAEMVHRSEDAQCPLHSNAGTDCGYPGIGKTECEAKGCCWDPSSPTNWCYPKSAPTPAPSPALECTVGRPCGDVPGWTRLTTAGIGSREACESAVMSLGRKIVAFSFTTYHGDKCDYWVPVGDMDSFGDHLIDKRAPFETCFVQPKRHCANCADTCGGHMHR